MPAFIVAPPQITPRRGLQEGIPGYTAGGGPQLFGQADSRFAITSVTANGATATITGALIEGPVPAVGGLISVRGSSAAGGVFNVTNIPISAVALNANGVGTISFALAQTVGATADSGQAIVPPTETFEALAAATKFQQFAIPEPPDLIGAGRQVLMVWKTATVTVIALQLEQAINDVDAEYAIVGVSQTALSGTLAALITGRFIRLNVTAETTAGTINAKFLLQ
jgi:hypothetical protein